MCAVARAEALASAKLAKAVATAKRALWKERARLRKVAKTAGLRWRRRARSASTLRRSSSGLSSTRQSRTESSSQFPPSTMDVFDGADTARASLRPTLLDAEQGVPSLAVASGLSRASIAQRLHSMFFVALTARPYVLWQDPMLCLATGALATSSRANT